MSAFKRIVGSFRMLRRRACEVRQPGLVVWADCGEKAAEAVKIAVRDGAHRVETRALTLAEELQAMMADGHVDLVELKRLKAMPARLNRIAEESRLVGEAVS